MTLFTNRMKGARPTVVALHGSASTGSQWRRLSEELSTAYDVHTPDLPGYGRAAHVEPSDSPSLASDGATLHEIAARTEGPIHLVAHSYGAAVALAFALRAPAALRSLTLIEPAMFHLLRGGPVADRELYDEICGVARAIDLSILARDPARGMARFVDYWNGAGSWTAMKPSLQEALAGQCTAVARNFRASMAETWHPRLCGWLGSQLPCPITVISMDESRGPARRVAEIIAEATPRAHHIRVPNVAHMAPVTHKHIINPIITEAISAAERRNDIPGLRDAA